MGRVFVMGSINQDYVLVVDRRPGAGETVTGATLDIRPGGKGANQAVAAAVWGAAVSLLARVGDDGAADTQRRDLSARGVDVSLVKQTAGTATGAAFITVTPDGENAVTVAPGANGMLRAADVDDAADLIAGSAVLVAQLEIPLEAVAAAVEACGPHTHVLLNAAPAAPAPRPDASEGRHPGRERARGGVAARCARRRCLRCPRGRRRAPSRRSPHRGGDARGARRRGVRGRHRHPHPHAGGDGGRHHRSGGRLRGNAGRRCGRPSTARPSGGLGSRESVRLRRLRRARAPVASTPGSPRTPPSRR